jgi:hypothetical protein
MTRFLAISWGLLALWLGGCAGYRLGPTNGLPAGSRTVQVNLFQNRTIEPRLSEATDRALRKRFQQEGTYRVATHGDADIIIYGEILRYDREAVAFQPKDVITPLDYEITITAHVVAEERATGRKLVDRVVLGRTTIRIGADQTSAERMSLPMLADDFAHNAAALLVDGTW